jgi:hypothetical protein
VLVLGGSGSGDSAEKRPQRQGSDTSTLVAPPRCPAFTAHRPNRVIISYKVPSGPADGAVGACDIAGIQQISRGEGMGEGKPRLQQAHLSRRPPRRASWTPGRPPHRSRPAPPLSVRQASSTHGRRPRRSTSSPCGKGSARAPHGVRRRGSIRARALVVVRAGRLCGTATWCLRRRSEGGGRRPALHRGSAVLRFSVLESIYNPN